MRSHTVVLQQGQRLMEGGTNLVSWNWDPGYEHSEYAEGLGRMIGLPSHKGDISDL
jgi:hypothetical protein